MAAALTATCDGPAAVLTVGTVPSNVLEDNLRLAPRDNHERQAEIVSLFRKAGCSDERLEQRALKHSKFSNVVCTLPGKGGAGVVVVGAHFDHVSAGEGVVDNWSGASLLPTLLASLRKVPRDHTFVFVAFAREEEGLLGSREFVATIPKEDRAEVRAMINIDSIGMASPAVWLSHADKQLAADAAGVAAAISIRLEAVNVDRAGDSDSSSFLSAHIPVIDFHSIHKETFARLHSSRDNFKAVDMKAYEDTFRFIAYYLAFIDQRLP